MIGRSNVISGDFTLQDPLKTNDTTTIKELHNKKSIVIKFLRRFGCPSTRCEAKELGACHEEFAKLGVELIAIGFDINGVLDFITDQVWNGKIYLDPQQQLYQFFDLKKMTRLTGVRQLFSSESKKRQGFTLKGGLNKNDLQMGGTFVINPSGKIIYKFYQSNYSDFPCVEDILTVCRAEVENSKLLNKDFNQLKIIDVVQIQVSDSEKDISHIELDTSVLSGSTQNDVSYVDLEQTSLEQSRILEEGGACRSQTWDHLDKTGSQVVSKLFAWDKTLSFATKNEAKNVDFTGQNILDGIL